VGQGLVGIGLGDRQPRDLADLGVEEDDGHRPDPVDRRGQSKGREHVERARHPRAAPLLGHGAQRDAGDRSHHEAAGHQRQVGGERGPQERGDGLEAQPALVRRAEVEVQEGALEVVPQLVEVARPVGDLLGPEGVEDAEHERGGADHDGDDREQAANDEDEQAGPRPTVAAA
jgi:hypothetical protein